MDGFKPRKLRIVESGLENYTGLFGSTNFVDGVSEYEVSWQEAHILSSVVRVVDDSDPAYQIGPVAETERNRNLPADSKLVKAVDSGVVTENGEIKLAAEHFTREELEAIASEKGLSGVRDIARAHGKTGRSIQECITAILEAQGDNPEQTILKE